MSFFDFFRLENKESNGFSYRLILDIGTEYLKAVIVEFNQSEKNILGFGIARQDYGNMDGGAITNIDGVVKRAREAIKNAYNYTPHRPKEMVSGLAGEFVKGVLVSQERERPNPHREINRSEINELVNKAQEKAYKKAVKMVEHETGVKDVKLELLSSTLVEVSIDGYRVNNPYQFKGKNINIVVFNAFAPLVQIGALKTVAQKLGFKLVATVADPFAIAKSIMNEESYEFGAIIIDIGGGTTDIALIRNGGVEGTRMFAMGGRAFTRTLASNLDVSFQEAEKIKLDYSNNKKIKNFEKVDKLIKSDLQILYQGIEISLQELAQGEVLPKNIYFCGGGSGLKGLIKGFRERNLRDNLPFFKDPNITILKGSDLNQIADENGFLTGVEHATPRSLALQGTTFQSKERRLLNFGS